jgi:diguanylate cyclase (GGDEF)-like protein/PAS domain S-box-containing protein
MPSLRLTTLGVIGTGLVGLLLLLYLAGRNSLLNSFAQLEAQEVGEDVERALTALDTSLLALATTAGDYAAWDDTYAFAGGRLPGYAEANLTPQTLANLGINVLVILGPAGQPRFSSSFDLAEEALVPMPDGLATHLDPGDPLLRHTSEDSRETGLLRLPDGVLLVASRPILTSDFAGPIGGTFILGRWLDAAEIARLSAITHLAWTVERIDEPAGTPDVLTARAAIASQGGPFAAPVDANTISGYAQLDDLYSQPALVLRIDLPRTVYQRGQASLAFFMFSLLAAGLVVAGLNWVLMERFVLRRVAQVAETVDQVGARGDLGLRAPVSGRDELARLAGGLNHMLQSLADSRQALNASEQKFRALAETSAAAIVIAQDGEIRYANPRAVALAGAEPDTRSAWRGALQSLFMNPSPAAAQARREIEMASAQGEAHWLDVSVGEISYEGRPAAIVTAYDVSERKRAEHEVQAAHARLTELVRELERRNREGALLSELSDLLQACATAPESHVTVAQFLPLLFPGLDCAVYIFRPSRDLLEAVAVSPGFPAAEAQRLVTPDGCWSLRLVRLHVAETHHTGALCAHVPPGFGQAYICVPLMAQGDVLGVLHVRLDAAGSAPDRSAETRRLCETTGERLALALANVNLREALRHQAIRDPLTGLFNRRYLQETLEREVSRATRHGHPLSIIFLDLDHFKQFNDAHGHDAGDALLRELGQLLLARLRADDIVCRYGGEEFVLILPEAALEAAHTRAESLRAEIRGMAVKHYGRLLGTVTASLGVATLPRHGRTGEQVLHAADQALYAAKQAGRDRVVVAG